jgi:hypothetical protein
MQPDAERHPDQTCPSCGSAVYEVTHRLDWGSQILLRVCSDPDCGTVITEPAGWRERD